MPETRDLNGTTHGHMSDADRLHDCMSSARERAKLYAAAALESTNNGVREFFLAMHGEETHNQEVLFSFLHTRGFYPVEMAAAERIREVGRRYTEMHDALGLTDHPSVRRYQTNDPRMHPAETRLKDHFDLKDRN